MNNISKSIGFIGIGLMGSSLIQRLSNYDQVIYAFDKDKKTLSGIKINNVHIANDAAEVAKKCDVIFICVDKTENVEHAVFDDNGVIQNATENTIIIDLSTTLVNETIKFSEKFKHKTGGAWIDAPVSGGPEKALDGTLSIMVGGDKKDINIISPLLDIISKKFTCFGPAGSGQVVKMINQILVLNNYTILAEALSFAEAWGVDAKKIPAALNDGHAGSNLLMTLFPRMINKDFEPKGYTSQILKDLTMLSQLAEEKNVPIPMSTLSKQLFTILANKSEQNLDGISIVKLFDKNKKI
jgi:3-hydroxyisobutyrate dehydrogenase